ncbi:MAG: ATP-binding protein [Puniceicoccaceae bacterium]
MNTPHHRRKLLKRVAGSLLALCACTVLPVSGEGIQGFPIYTIYHYEDLGAELPGGYLYEDEHGQIILASEGHIERFDGRNWTNLSLHHQEHGDEVLRLAGSGNRFYCGIVGGWGRIRVSETGAYEIEPLMTREQMSEVAAVNFNQIRLLEDSVLFWGERGVVHYSPEFGNRIWNEIDDPLTVFTHESRLYVSSNTQGVHCIEGTRLRKLAGSEQYGGALALVDSVHFAEKTLLASRNGGLFRMQGEKMERVETSVDELLRRGISKLARLDDDYLAVVLPGVGLLILDNQLRAALWLDGSLDSNFASIRDLIYTSEGILWATTPVGLIKMMYPSALSVLDHRNGLKMLWPKAAFLDDQLVVYSAKQIFLAELQGATPMPSFRRLEVNGRHFFDDAAFVQDGMLLSSEQRLLHYVMDSGDVHPVMEGPIISKTIPCQSNPDLAIACSLDQFFLLHRSEEGWHYTGKSHPSIGFAAVYLESDRGEIWVEQGLGKASRIMLDPENLDFSVQAFDQVPEVGLRWVNVFEVDGEVYLKTHDQLAVFDPERAALRTVPFPEFLQFPFAGLISRPVEDANGDLWLPSESGLFVGRRDESGVLTPDFERFELIRDNNPTVVPMPDGGAFIQTRDRLIYHHPRVSSPPRSAGNPVLSMVRPMGGHPPVYSIYSGTSTRTDLTLPYARNSLLFEFFDNSFYYRKTPLFQTQLEGLTDSWSEPSADTRVVFNQIREGRYTFRVRSINAFGIVSPPAEISFVVLPPWYRTWWAYALVIVGAAALLTLIIVNLLRASERERKRLSTLVGQRTAELVRLNHELLDTAERAERASEAKSQFLANMSHEIRTPLNGIIGMADALRNARLGKAEREMVDIINQSGEFLIAIINDILDYSKIEADGVELVPAPTRIDQLLEEVLGVFSGWVREKSLSMLHGWDPSHPLYFQVDALRLKQILMNLVSNAVKFTQHGWIGVEVDVQAHEQPGWCWVTFTVDDSGVGIPESQRTNLFQPFQQLDTADNRNFGGTGLGLVICRRLAELMNGSITIEPKTSPGSRFCVRLPLEMVQEAQPVVSLSGLRIALVGHTVQQTCLIAKTLRGTGATVYETDDAASWIQDAPPVDWMCVIAPATYDFGDEVKWNEDQTLPARIWISHDLQTPLPRGMVRLPQPFRYDVLFSTLKAGNALPEPEDKPPHPPDPKTEKNASFKVLLVEDNLTNRRVAEILLGKLGIVFDGAENGEEALRCCEQTRYAVVLMDIQMPVMDGYEAAKRLRADPERYGNPQIIALTAGALKVDQENARAVGMDAFLAKPIRMEELRQAMLPFLRKDGE